MDYKIIELNKKELPQKLQLIKNPPEKLYLIGNKNLIFEDCFAIIGTRRITEYGIYNCKNFTKELVLRDVPIVSGMAIGTDTIAHETALEYDGKTIAVLGSGFNNIFPKENINLFKQIIENNGLIISEFEENEKPLKDNFPKRNRIITGLSEGVLVIEAAYRSGTTITAKNAKEQGKKVFALPGKLNSSVGIGVNNMIKKGAILTTEIDDILCCYPQFENRKRKSVSKKINKSGNLKEKYKKIYNFLKKEELYLDEILIKTGFNIKDIFKILNNMELDGFIEQDSSGKYKIK